VHERLANHYSLPFISYKQSIEQSIETSNNSPTNKNKNNDNICLNNMVWGYPHHLPPHAQIDGPHPRFHVFVEIFRMSVMI